MAPAISLVKSVEQLALLIQQGPDLGLHEKEGLDQGVNLLDAGIEGFRYGKIGLPNLDGLLLQTGKGARDFMRDQQGQRHHHQQNQAGE